MRHRHNLKWLAEKLASPEQWSVRDRDDITFFIEQKRAEFDKTPEHHEPLRSRREEALAELEEAMEIYVASRQPWPPEPAAD